MTIEAGERASNRNAGRDDVSGSVVTALVDLTRSRMGEGGVAQVLALADDRRAFADLADRHRWSSLDQVVALFNAASLVTGDGAVALHVGEMLLQSAGADLNGALGEPGGPAPAFEDITRVVAGFDATASATAVEVGADHALVRVTPKAGTSRHAHLCEMTRGLLSSVPAAFGLPPGIITESECSARGGRFCLYAVSWGEAGQDADAGSDDAETELGPGAGRGSRVAPEDERDGEPDAALHAAPDELSVVHETGGPRPGQDGFGSAPLGSERESEPEPAPEPQPEPEPAGVDTAEPGDPRLQQMANLFEDALATTLDLLANDTQTVLEHVAGRADDVVAAERYVLVVRIGPGAPIHVHWRGLDPEEAQRLADELWTEHPDEKDPTRLVVDIASPRRRYGRMVELLAPGTVAEPGEAHLLSLYATYAATALDIYSALTDATRANATARALLSFSERLSRVTDVSDAVQLIADVVPEVTGCDRATIYLWNDRVGHLVPRARTTGREAGTFSGTYAVTGTPVRQAAVPRDPIRRTPPGADPPDPEAGTDHGQVESDAAEPATSERDVVNIPTNVQLTERLVDRREVIVIDRDINDTNLRRLLVDTDTQASVIAPLFTAGELLGTLAASFGVGTPESVYRDPDVHERLAGLADQAATALQNLDLLEKVSHMAWHDALTGLPNRRLFEDRVEQELVRSRRVGEPVCMFFVDIDHFKTVNDTFGHATGDELIQQVSDRLVETVRSQDTVARVGGDEFAILLPGLADQLDIDQLAQRTLEALAEPFVVAEEEVESTVSIGIAIAPEHGDSYDDLLNRADEAMYRAKSRGRNRFQMYSPTLDRDRPPSSLDERTLYRDLVAALGSDQFFVVFQPYVDLRTTEVLGVEALLRWNHPEHGVLEPAAFVPIAERSDAIVRLDAWVLEQACAQARRWGEAGLPAVRLSVNLASRDLADPDYAKTIARILSNNGIEPDRLELDITERVDVVDSPMAQTNVERLRRLGVRFTVDDFGTASSSLTRIGTFPVSTLKIDRSFVQVLSPDGDEDLVSAIVQMADRLGLACVAEGVETSAQRQVLLQRGCTAGQGYYLCPPLAARDLEEVLTLVGGDEGDGGADAGGPGGH